MNQTVKHLLYVLCALSIGLLGSVLRAVPVAAKCDYYASPTGSGTTGSHASPFKIAAFWTVAQAGDTLNLLDGEYKYDGANSLLVIPSGINGTVDLPITIRAYNDGGAIFNGEGTRNIVYLNGNSYLIIERINVHNSYESAVTVTGNSSHNIIRRVCAWDAGAADGNNQTFDISNGSTYNLIEDCAGWGRTRKIYQTYNGADHNVIRRCFGMWNENTNSGPKMVFSLGYDSRHNIIENCIGTFNGTGSNVYGIFSIDAIRDQYSMDKNFYSSYLGCIAYTLPTDSFSTTHGSVFIENANSVTLKDIVVIRPSTSTVKPFYLSSWTLPTHGTNLTADNLTSVGMVDSFNGASDADYTSYVYSDWTVTNKYNVVNNGPSGHNLCYRYVDGVLTTTPLWPWPMNDRIKSAMVQSGKSSVDVTQIVEALLGQIPVECRSPSTPDAPLNLRVIP